MNSLLKKSAIAAVVVLALASCKKEASNTDAAVSAAPATEQTATQTTAQNADATTADFTITPQLEAYTIGANIADGLKNSLESLPESISLDKNEVLKGFQDGLTGKSTLNAEQRQEVLVALNQRIADEQKAAYEKLSADNKKAGDEFRADFAKQEGVVTTESGLMYKIIEAGNDNHPSDSSIVTVTYKGTFVNGEVFDEATEMTSFPLLVTIKGWQEGLPHLGVGGKMQLVIPPDLGYGEDSQNLPPNSTLVFDIHLINVEADPNNPEV